MIEFEKFKWRLTKKEDLDYVKELENNGYPYVLKWEKSQHEKALEDDNIRNLILEEKGSKIGYCILAGFTMGNDSIEIKRIVVEVKNRGIGRKSLKAIIKYLFEEKNVHRVWLDYHQFNEVGAYLYESMGFIKEGVLRESLKLDGKYYDVVVLSMLKSEYFQN